MVIYVHNTLWLYPPPLNSSLVSYPFPVLYLLSTFLYFSPLVQPVFWQLFLGAGGDPTVFQDWLCTPALLQDLANSWECSQLCLTFHFLLVLNAEVYQDKKTSQVFSEYSSGFQPACGNQNSPGYTGTSECPNFPKIFSLFCLKSDTVVQGWNLNFCPKVLWLFHNLAYSWEMPAAFLLSCPQLHIRWTKDLHYGLVRETNTNLLNKFCSAKAMTVIVKIYWRRTETKATLQKKNKQLSTILLWL